MVTPKPVEVAIRRRHLLSDYLSWVSDDDIREGEVPSELREESPHPEALRLFTAAERTLAMFGSVWRLAVAQRHLNRPFQWADPSSAAMPTGR